MSVPDPFDYVLLSGVTGSTAHGLARDGSDVDRATVAAWKTERLFDLTLPSETLVEHEPDHTCHEVAKFIRLGLKCNPTIVEFLWLEDYDVITNWGHALRTMRIDMLSEACVRGAYGGYAIAQIRRLERREAEGKRGFASDLQNRTAKHARHCFRLLEQGKQLLQTASLTVRVPDPEKYWAFDDMPTDEIVRRFDVAIEDFDNTQSILPHKPNRGGLEWLLHQIRREYLT